MQTILNSSSNFLGDIYLVNDLINLNKEQFLQKNNFINTLQYNITRDLLYSKKEYIKRYKKIFKRLESE